MHYEARIKTADGGIENIYDDRLGEGAMRARVSNRVDALNHLGGPCKVIGYNIWSRSRFGAVAEIGLPPGVRGFLESP
jgi:hypothetical protein